MKKWGILLVLLWSTAGYGICEIAAQTEFEKGLASAIKQYEQCALSKNDDDILVLLAKTYLNGENGIEKNIQKALLFYQLSAENGNAQSQVELSKLLTQMDEKENTRQVLKTYLSKMKFFMKNQDETTFDGEFLHPYALLALAAEPVNQKWYYPTDVLTAPDAKSLLKKYKISAQKKTVVMKGATAWKQRKMMEAAQEIYSPADYEKFVQIVKPANGRADGFARSQAVLKLQKDIQAYKEK